VYADRIFSHITHPDPQTNSKGFAHLDTIQHFSLELSFLIVVRTRVPFSYISQTLWGEAGLAVLHLQKGCTSENVSAFSSRTDVRATLRYCKTWNFFPLKLSHLFGLPRAQHCYKHRLLLQRTAAIQTRSPALPCPPLTAASHREIETRQPQSSRI